MIHFRIQNVRGSPAEPVATRKAISTEDTLLYYGNEEDRELSSSSSGKKL